MAATCDLNKGIIRAEKLSIFTFTSETNEWIMREYIFKHWNILSEGMEDSTILFLAGVHGLEDGRLGPNADSIETMQTQVSN